MRQLQDHVERLRACRHCSLMQAPAVSGGAVLSKVMLVGQAPGDKEPRAGKPFAWTAGKNLFRWFHQSLGMMEDEFRNRVYMAAVCRCFPGKKPAGGDRVPERDEIQKCSAWLDAEISILEPELVIAVGKLAIQQFLAMGELERTVGKLFRVKYQRHRFDLLPLPHPSGASPWPHLSPGKELLARALKLLAKHPAMQRVASEHRRTLS